MKHSFYNIDVVTDSGEHVLYNTLHGSLAVLDPQAYQHYETLSGKHLPALHRVGFVLDDPYSEIEAQHAWFERDKKSTEALALCIAPTYKCNLACPHCYEKHQDVEPDMSDEIAQRILQLTDGLYQRDSFKRLFITWYGGEPTLCMSTIANLSQILIDFCDHHGIIYGAEIITNATLVDESLAKRLADCRISQAMPTLSGKRDTHNQRRCWQGDKDSFELTLRGIEHLNNAGITVNVSLNMDKRSHDEFIPLRDWLSERNISAMPTMIADYLGELGDGFDLYTREEFSDVVYDWFKDDYKGAGVLRGFLSPTRNFCRRQLENYFVIDALGDVYKCDGRMGYQEYALFNILDDVPVATLETADDNPMDDPLCRECKVLPLCKGQCAWDRAELEDGCHPLKYTIDQYVKDYRNCFGKAEEPVTLFTQALNLEEFFSTPHYAEGLTASSF